MYMYLYIISQFVFGLSETQRHLVSNWAELLLWKLDWLIQYLYTFYTQKTSKLRNEYLRFIQTFGPTWVWVKIYKYLFISKEYHMKFKVKSRFKWVFTPSFRGPTRPLFWRHRFEIAYWSVCKFIFKIFVTQ